VCDKFIFGVFNPQVRALCITIYHVTSSRPGLPLRKLRDHQPQRLHQGVQGGLRAAALDARTLDVELARKR
jgi:hypothetical protein